MRSSRMMALLSRSHHLAKERAKITTELMDVYGQIQREQEAHKVTRSVEYQAYLESPEWKEKTVSVRLRAGNRCQLCNTKDHQLHVHHRTYERLGAELPEDLIALCAPCHRKFHNIDPEVEEVTA